MPDTLYIIGNGFDLHHGLKTSYLNFRDDYVKKKSSVLWNDLLDIYGEAPQNNNLWWKDFENMLGKVDYDSLSKSRNGDALGFMKVRNLMKGKLPPLFGKWIKDVDSQIDASKIKLMDEIDASSLYNKDQLRISPSYSNQINQETLNGAKKVKDSIWKEEERFDQYWDIKHFMVMGFSFNNIDLPYIEKIWNLNRHRDEVEWTVYVHTSEDESIIKTLMDIGVSKHNIHTKNW